MLAQLVIKCHDDEINRVSQYIKDTGLAQNVSISFKMDSPSHTRVYGDYVEYFDPSLEQAKALECLRQSSGVISCELHF